MFTDLSELDARTLEDIAEWLKRAFPDTAINAQSLAKEEYRLLIAQEQGSRIVREAFVIAARQAKERANGS